MRKLIVLSVLASAALLGQVTSIPATVPGLVGCTNSGGVLTCGGFSTSGPYSGSSYYAGVSSGGVALAAADAAGTAIVYVLPSTNGTSGEVLSDSGATTCPTLPSGWPTTCHLLQWISAGGGSGTVTSVAFTGGLISVASPTTTPAFTVAGTSGGFPYFNSASTWLSSDAGTAGDVVLWGGAGNPPTAGAVGANIVTASSPGAGIAHFAGSTQAVTSSPVSLTADVTGVLPAVNGGLPTVTISCGGTGTDTSQATVTPYEVACGNYTAQTASLGTLTLLSSAPAGLYELYDYWQVTTNQSAASVATVVSYTDDKTSQVVDCTLAMMTGGGPVSAAGCILLADIGGGVLQQTGSTVPLTLRVASASAITYAFTTTGQTTGKFAFHYKLYYLGS